MAIFGTNVADGSSVAGLSATVMDVNKYTLASAQTLNELHGIFVGTGSWNVRLVIYADSSGLPGARVANTNSLTTGTGNPVEVQQTGFAVALAAGDYWLGYSAVSQVSGSKSCNGKTGGTFQRQVPTADPPPNPFGTPATSGARTLNVWAVVSPPTAVPVVDFTGTPTSGTASLSVTFTDSSSNTPTSWAWDFGDGGTSTSQNPSHSYTTSGVYTVTLQATNSAGSDTKTRTAYITVRETISYASGGGVFIY